ncbi:hypothetical protein TRAPUB_5941 [Trametes pubescens]|uniref:Uncharacterized protein n=1 Tax=Trametes pubescens TaxID=154538 RepID=A0A1M2W706_TRAPU|nr:hypothetical protein TRAPUB_5941 [Trametes pubescens]
MDDLTLSEKCSHAIVLPSAVVHRTTAPIPNKNVRTGPYREFNQAKVLAPRRLMQKGAAGGVI